MHILSFGQVQGIAGLIGVHDMLVVLQTQRVANGIVERQVDIVGKIGEDAGEMGTQRMSQTQLRLSGQLRLYLGGHISHQAQLIVQLVVVTAHRQVVVNDGTRSQGCPTKQAA